MSRRVVLAVALAVLAAGLTACASKTKSDLAGLDTGEGVAASLALSQAESAARQHQAATASFAGFTAAVAAEIEPSIVWTDGGPATEGQVSIRGVSAGGLVLVTAQHNGEPACLSVSTGGSSSGNQDAQTAADCSS